ncbi:hypothetical protein [Mycobacterium marinum]|uniref:hypothetical protein n=1 Tax=Mycobacterium marinum TaxID=1781 RepID=UPI00235918D1|nr:hypothetical protein [Mycobacterium marinum]MDC8970842.1 hypothetical protein [Mycobacterium marinum]
MPGHTPYEAVQNYRDPIIRAIRTLNPQAYIAVGSRSDFQVGAEGYWRLVDEDGLRLTPKNGSSSMRFMAEQRYKIIDCEPGKHEPELGCFRVTTLMYAYELIVDRVKVWKMHWHPDGKSDEFRPHYHISGCEDQPFSVKDHLPSGRHTIEDAVEWCIRHGASPADGDWATVIAETKGVHVLHRSWSISPNEPRG